MPDPAGWLRLGRRLCLDTALFAVHAVNYMDFRGSVGRTKTMSILTATLGFLQILPETKATIVSGGPYVLGTGALALPISLCHGDNCSLP